MREEWEIILLHTNRKQQTFVTMKEENQKSMLPEHIQESERFCYLSGGIWEQFRQNKISHRQFFFLQSFGSYKLNICLTSVLIPLADSCWNEGEKNEVHVCKWRNIVEWSMHRGLHHRFLAIQFSECQWNQLYKYSKNLQNFRWSCTDFMDLWKKLMKSPRFNSNSCTEELVLHGGVYDRNIV